MKVTIENTDQIVEVVAQSGTNPIPARVWVGKTESGIDIQVLVTRIAVSKNDDCSQFEKELRETSAPKAEEYWQAFPLRLIL